MKRLKVMSMINMLVISTIMFGGIAIVTYYVDNLKIRSASIALLMLAGCLTSHTMRLIFNEAKKHNGHS